MKIVYLSNEIYTACAQFDDSCLSYLADKVIAYSPPFDETQLQSLLDNPGNDICVIVSKDPQWTSLSNHAFFPVELANLGVNPGNVGFVDLTHILMAAHDAESVVSRLQIHVGLTFIKLAYTKEYPQKNTEPVKKMLVLGAPASAGFVRNIHEMGIDVISLYSNSASDIAEGAVIESLSGMPGKYCIEIRKVDNTIAKVDVGAIVIYPDMLSVEQRKEIASQCNLVMKKDLLWLLPNQLRLSQAIKIIGEKKSGYCSEEDALDFFQAFFKLAHVTYFIEDPVIYPEKCGLCGTCVKTCLFHASALEERGGQLVSTIYSDKCVACGNCVTACPTMARDLPSYSHEFYTNAWQQLQLFKGDADGLKILVIYCESNGHDAIQYLAHNEKPVPPSCLFLRIRCGARADTQFIPDSFRAGFDGVAVVTCSRDECGNIVGSLDLERRLNLYRRVLQMGNVETGRMRIMPLASDQLASLGDSLQQFAEYLQNLKQDRKLFSTFLK